MDTICSYLAYDHARCDNLFVQAVAHVAAREWPRALKRTGDFESAFARHMEMEESIIFRALEGVIGTPDGPTADLRKEHELLRGLLARVSQAVQDRKIVDFFDFADTFRIMMRQHSLKEEGILYPMADRMLADQRADLVASMVAISIVHHAPSMA